MKEINELIGFKPVDDTVRGIFYDCDTIQDNFSADKKIIANVSKEYPIISQQDTSDNYHGQIFILQRENGKLKIIDSTKEFEKLGRFDVCFLSDTLRIQQNYHKGGYDFYYLFNSHAKKYNLITIENANVLNEDKEYNNVPTGVEVRLYNIVKQELTIKKLDDWDGKVVKSRTIKRKLPKEIIPDLVHFINPVDNLEIEKLYDKIFDY